MNIIMKKIFLLALLPLLFITSCSDDDDKSENIKPAIIGTWQELFYWDRTDWHTWGFVAPPVWEFKSDKTYLHYASTNDYQTGKPDRSGTWDVSEKYLTTDVHARKYSLSDDKQTLTWENVAILKRK